MHWTHFVLLLSIDHSLMKLSNQNGAVSENYSEIIFERILVHNPHLYTPTFILPDSVHI